VTSEAVVKDVVKGGNKKEKLGGWNIRNWSLSISASWVNQGDRPFLKRNIIMANLLRSLGVFMLMTACEAQRNPFDITKPVFNDVNVNYKDNQSGEIKAGKMVKPYMGKKKISRKQRKIKRNKN
jgi:hypothetical protein